MRPPRKKPSRAHVQYLSYLQKGQAAPAALSLTASTVKLSLDTHRYIVHAARSAPDAFELTLNATTVEVVARKLPDGSVLTQVDGAAHVIHAEEEVSGTRLIIDNLTVLLPNEHDPSRLQAHSPGKLVRCASALTCWPPSSNFSWNFQLYF